MKYINKYKKYIESISGTELVGKHTGPNYPFNELPSTLKSKDTSILYSDFYNKIITQDEYQSIYIEYLKKGGKPLSGFNLENIEKVLKVINENIIYVDSENVKLITEAFNDSFTEFLTDYSMIAQMDDGHNIDKYGGWMSDTMWSRIKYKVDPSIGKVNWPKSIKISIMNEQCDPSIGNGDAKFEIFIDDNSESKFKESVKTFESILRSELDGFIRIDYPEKLDEDWWVISMYVVYSL